MPWLVYGTLRIDMARVAYMDSDDGFMAFARAIAGVAGVEPSQVLGKFGGQATDFGLVAKVNGTIPLEIADPSAFVDNDELTYAVFSALDSVGGFTAGHVPGFDDPSTWLGRGAAIYGIDVGIYGVAGVWNAGYVLEVASAPIADATVLMMTAALTPETLAASINSELRAAVLQGTLAAAPEIAIERGPISAEPFLRLWYTLGVDSEADADAASQQLAETTPAALTAAVRAQLSLVPESMAGFAVSVVHAPEVISTSERDRLASGAQGVAVGGAAASMFFASLACMPV